MKRLLPLLLILTSCGPGLNSGVEKLAGDGASRATPTPTPDPSVTPSPSPTPTPSPEKTFTDLMSSLMHRVGVSSPITLSAEAKSGVSLPSGYKEDTTSVTEQPSVVIDYATTDWNVDCGLSGLVENRIADCALKHPTHSAWDGVTNGNMGESLWKLVYRKGPAGTPKEVWLDTRTGLLWSDYLIDEGDVSPESFTWSTAVDACRNSDTDFAAEKGSLGTTEGVYWRMPTLSDIRLAMIGGLFWVYDPARHGAEHWAATSAASNPGPAGDAWYYWAKGSMDTTPKSSEFFVRCAGRYTPTGL